MDPRVCSVLEKEFKNELHPSLREKILCGAANRSFINRGEIVRFVRSEFLGSQCISGDRPLYWQKRGWTKEEAIEKAAARSKRPATISPFSPKFWEGKLPASEIAAKIKSLRPTSIEYWIAKGFDSVAAAEQLAQFQVTAGNIAKDKKQKDPQKYVGTLPSHYEYWTKRGFSVQQARQKVKEHQTTFSLEKCIAKYGEVDGRRKWKERQDKWLKTLEVNGTRGTDSSLLADSFLQQLLQHFPTAKCAIAGGEKRIRIGAKTYSVDFFYKGKIIEVNGDFWHANPSKYLAEATLSFPGGRKTAGEIWEKDFQRSKDLISVGYTLLVLWEADILTNRDAELGKAISFLKEPK